MAFDFENNIQSDLSIPDIYDKETFIQACEPILKSLHLHMSIGSKDNTIFVETTYSYEDFSKIYESYHIFAFFLQVYDISPYAFSIYNIDVMPAFGHLFRKAQRCTVKDTMLSAGQMVYHMNLMDKYFCTNEGRIKYDIPMILSYLAFINKHLKQLPVISYSYYVHLIDRILINLPIDIISKEELWQFILTIEFNPLKFNKIRIGDTFQSMLEVAIFKHYGISTKEKNWDYSNLLLSLNDHIIESLYSENIICDNKEAYVLDI